MWKGKQGIPREAPAKKETRICPKITEEAFQQDKQASTRVKAHREREREREREGVNFSIKRPSLTRKYKEKVRGRATP